MESPTIERSGVTWQERVIDVHYTAREIDFAGYPWRVIIEYVRLGKSSLDGNLWDWAGLLGCCTCRWFTGPKPPADGAVWAPNSAHASW